jgi:bidirectional [NiFe] hydrogenase diaphorase subunit
MKQITLTIDGQSVIGSERQTLLQVARNNGITIPTLCNYRGLDALGACRVCIVEIEGAPRPLPACATLAEAGMVVSTCTEQIQNNRRLIVELLLAERNHTCPVCVMNGSCELQSLAKELNIDHVRYDYLTPHLQVDMTRTRFGIDHNRCILCRRCVRVCDRIEGAHTWDVCGRGTTSLIISDLAQPWGESGTCTDCGKCVHSCPTGALFEQGPEKPRTDAVNLEKIVKWRNRSFP